MTTEKMENVKSPNFNEHDTTKQAAPISRQMRLLLFHNQKKTSPFIIFGKCNNIKRQ